MAVWDCVLHEEGSNIYYHAVQVGPQYPLSVDSVEGKMLPVSFFPKSPSRLLTLYHAFTLSFPPEVVTHYRSVLCFKNRMTEK